MKRTILSTHELTIVSIEKSLKYANEGFIVTEEKGTSLHPSLTSNDQNVKYGRGGSFVINDIKEKGVVKSLSHKLNVSPDFVMRNIECLSPKDQPSTLVVELEKRIVGEILEDENGNPVKDSTGNVVRFGTQYLQDKSKKLGEEYYVANVAAIEPSSSLKTKCYNFLDSIEREKALHQEEVVEFLPRKSFRRVPSLNELPELNESAGKSTKKNTQVA